MACGAGRHLCNRAFRPGERGAARYYFAGGFGSFLVAAPPEPGFSIASQTLMYGGQASRAVLLFRNFGDFNVKLSQYVVAPTGHSDVNNVINVGRNAGRSAPRSASPASKGDRHRGLGVPGIMFGTTNPASDYHTGTYLFTARSRAWFGRRPYASGR